MPVQVVANGKLVSLVYKICDESGRVLEQSDLPVTYIHGGQKEVRDPTDQELEQDGMTHAAASGLH